LKKVLGHGFLIKINYHKKTLRRNVTMVSTTKSWAESAASDASEFFTLSPSKLSSALVDAIPMDELSADQQLYARSVLLHIASDSVTTMHEDARINGGLAARKISPAYSIARVVNMKSACTA